MPEEPAMCEAPRVRPSEDAVTAVPNLLDLTADAVAGGGRWCLQDRTGSSRSDPHG
jgi:hypothetical protein